MSESKGARFGHIPGIEVGARWPSRQACSEAGVHAGTMQGIHGSKTDGAYSVALSGQYKDDDDQGETFIYTGTGGRLKTNSAGKTVRLGPQVLDQTFDHHQNKALLISSKTKKPVRVIRGFQGTSIYAPPEGYRYDGLYVVEDAWMETGIAGHKVCRFAFRRLPGQPPLPTLEYGLNLNHRKKTVRARHVSPEASSPEPVAAPPQTSAKKSTKSAASSQFSRMRKLIRAKEMVDLGRLSHTRTMRNTFNVQDEAGPSSSTGVRVLSPRPLNLRPHSEESGLSRPDLTQTTLDERRVVAPSTVVHTHTLGRITSPPPSP